LRSDPVEFAQVKLGLATPYHLIQEAVIADNTDAQAVGFGNIVKIVGGYPR
jgi:hypothetical protein